MEQVSDDPKWTSEDISKNKIQDMIIDIQPLTNKNLIWWPTQNKLFDTDEFFRSTNPEALISDQIQKLTQQRKDNDKWSLIESIKLNNFMRMQKTGLQERLQEKQKQSIPLDLDRDVQIIDENYSPRTQSQDNVGVESDKIDTNSADEQNDESEVRDPGIIKKFGGFKWYEQALIIDALSDTQLTQSLDIGIQELEIKQLTDTFASLNKEFVQISSQKELVDEKYRQLIVASTLTEKAILETQKNINKRIATIQELNKQLKQSQIRMNTIAPDLEQATRDVVTYTQSYYKLHNDIFATQSNNTSALNELKLFAKADNVAETLASDVMIQDLTATLDNLVSRLWILKATYAAWFARYNNQKKDLNQETDIYNQEKTTLTQQVENFEELLIYVRSKKAYTDNKQKELEEAKTELEEEVEYISLIANAESTEDLEQIKKQFADKTLEEESRFFSFPLAEIKKITSFFEDEWYEDHFHTSHYALDFRLAQWAFVYAPAPGYVYKVVNQNSSMLNRFILLHSNGFATVYLHMQDTYVRPGMYIKKWEILWLSGWTPGTRGAGLMTTGPHLHREVWKNGELVDPLMYTDLSPIATADMLQRRHTEKWKRDNE